MSCRVFNVKTFLMEGKYIVVERVEGETCKGCCFFDDIEKCNSVENYSGIHCGREPVIFKIAESNKELEKVKEKLLKEVDFLERIMEGNVVKK